MCLLWRTLLLSRKVYVCCRDFLEGLEEAKWGLGVFYLFFHRENRNWVTWIWANHELRKRICAWKWDQEPLSSPNTLVPYNTSTLQSKANHKIDIHETIKMDSEDAAWRTHKVCVDFGSKAPELSVSRVLKSNEQRELEIHWSNNTCMFFF